MGEATNIYFTCLKYFKLLTEEIIMAAMRLASRALLRSALATAPTRHGIATTAVCLGNVKMPHFLEHAVGVEKWEKIAKIAGCDDVWGMGPMELGPGTKEEPTLVPSVYNKRLIGHQCEDDQTYLTYFYVYKGFPKRCQCGHWFKVVDPPSLELKGEMPEHIRKALDAAYARDHM